MGCLPAAQKMVEINYDLKKERRKRKAEDKRGRRGPRGMEEKKERNCNIQRKES
jgi:hypothetical protein